MPEKPFKRALISVYDKSGVVELGRRLVQSGCEIVASEGTAKALSDAGILVTRIEEVTGQAEILEGRVKTLHPKIFGAILADVERTSHQQDLNRSGITPIDLVIVNLYPFEERRSSSDLESEIIEEIDIGGVALIRAAAKNFKHVAVISSISQYSHLSTRLETGFSAAERRELAASAFAMTQRYDAAISHWFNPAALHLSAEHVQSLRYGENPHQKGELYRFTEAKGITSARLLHGKAMSFNNYLDADAAFHAVSEHREHAVAIIKHTNPSGIAVASTAALAYRNALRCDPVSAFGGVVASNTSVDATLALEIAKIFTEVVVAPSFEAEALAILRQSANLRILQCDEPTQNSSMEIRSISGGFLTQTSDSYDQQGDDPRNWTLVSGEAASGSMLEDLEFAWRCVRSIRSNAVIIAKEMASVGIGMGQVNRLNSARLAVSAAKHAAINSVAASDAFFPFADGISVLIEAGVRAIVQPGGSKRDDEVVAAAQAAGVTMYFTGVRHFSHS